MPFKSDSSIDRNFTSQNICNITFHFVQYFVKLSRNPSTFQPLLLISSQKHSQNQSSIHDTRINLDPKLFFLPPRLNYVYQAIPHGKFARVKTHGIRRKKAHPYVRSLAAILYTFQGGDRPALSLAAICFYLHSTPVAHARSLFLSRRFICLNLSVSRAGIALFHACLSDADINTLVLLSARGIAERSLCWNAGA